MVLREATRRVQITAVDAAVIACYVLGALLLYSHLWTDLDRAYLVNSLQDQNMFEWFFGVAAYAPDDALVTTLQNHPLGVNMMANTSMLGLGIPLAPVTWVFGTTATWAVVLTGGMAGSAAGWYWVISRHLAQSRIGAAIGGGFCAFAPPMISHANAHPNFVAMFVLPFIVSRVIVLARGGNPVRNGLALGLLITYQVFVGEEPLLIAAITLVVYGCARPATVTRNLLKGLGVAVLVTLPLVAYPVWKQFYGPQSYSNMGHGAAGNDLAAMTAFGRSSLAGDSVVRQRLESNPTEENAFFGWPLVILVVVLAIWLWRVASARALVITAGVMAVFSLGWWLSVNGEKTGIPMPWMAFSQLPLLNSLLGARLSMACVPVIGILIAMACQRILTLAEHATHIPLRLLWFGTLAAVLLPIAPTPFQTVQRPVTPEFFTEGMWRDYAGPDRSVIMVPPATSSHSLPLYWQAQAGMGFPIIEGYFVGPGTTKEGHYGAIQRPTSRLLEAITRGEEKSIGPDEREQARRDVEFWRASAVVLGPSDRPDELRRACDALFGTGGRYVGGVWVWPV
ncbi:glycosyl transferase [Kibdelosporangium banguiense]